MEIWDIYDSCFEQTGRLHERGKPMMPGDYHLVVSIFPVNSKGQILIQKRSDSLIRYPGVWAETGGSAIAGESAWQACFRELKEELGIECKKEFTEMIGVVKKTSAFITIWTVETDVPVEELKLQKEEVADARWEDPQVIRDMIDKKEFHDCHYFDWLSRVIKERMNKNV